MRLLKLETHPLGHAWVVVPETVPAEWASELGSEVGILTHPAFWESLDDAARLRLLDEAYRIEAERHS